MAVFLFSIITIILPAAAVILLWNGKNNNKTDWLLWASVTGSVVLFSFLAGTWSFSSYYLRYFFAAAFFVAGTVTYIKIKNRSIFAHRHEQRISGIAVKIVVLAVFTILNILVIIGFYHPGQAVYLAFPLRGGTYSVIQGGNSPITNFFYNANHSQKFAIDIVKLNGKGNRAKDLFPRSPSRYEIFGDILYSPCDGTVVKSRDGVQDNFPPIRDKENPAGNFIVIRCGDVDVLIAHMMKGSVLSKAGESVKAGQPIGNAGNSGNSIEPHLHIHAVKASDNSPEGEPVPMFFGGRFLTMNSVVVSKGKE